MVLKVLIVDDDPVIRRLLGSLIKRRFGARVQEAENGQVALEIVASEVPDLILLDVSMPVMDGPAMLTALRADLRLAAVPVVTISAAGEREVVVRMIDLGVADYLRKPFNLAAVEKRLARVLTSAGLGDW